MSYVCAQARSRSGRAAAEKGVRPEFSRRFGREARASRRFGLPPGGPLLNRDWLTSDSELIWSLVLIPILSLISSQFLSQTLSRILSKILSQILSQNLSQILGQFFSQISYLILSPDLSLIVSLILSPAAHFRFCFDIGHE